MSAADSSMSVLTSKPIVRILGRLVGLYHMNLVLLASLTLTAQGCICQEPARSLGGSGGLQSVRELPR